MSTNPNDSAAPKLPPKPPRELVKVIYDYTAQNEDELTLRMGDIITIVTKDNVDAGWWKGELKGRIALFPDNFVEPFSTCFPIGYDPEKEKKSDRTSNASINLINNSSLSSSAPTTNTTTIGNASKISPVFISTCAKTQDSTVLTLVGSSGNKVQENVTPALASSNKSPSNDRESELGNNTTTTPNVVSMQILKKLGFGRNNTPTNNSNNNSNVSTNSVGCTENANGAELRNEFGANNATQKLVHLTTSRPKIPTNNRRPPSVISCANTNGIEDGDGAFSLGTTNSNNNTQDQSSSDPSDNESSANETNGRASGLDVSQSLTAAVTTRSGAKSAAEELPYLREMREKQEAKRNSELLQQSIPRKQEDNASQDNLIALKKSAPPPPIVGTKPQLSNSNKPVVLAEKAAPAQQQQASTTTASTPTTPEVSVSNLKNKFVPMPHGNNNISCSLNKSLTTVARPPPLPMHSSKLGTSQSLPSTSSGPAALTPKVALKKPITQSIAPQSLEDFQKLHIELKEMKEQFKSEIERINAQHDATVRKLSGLCYSFLMYLFSLFTDHANARTDRTAKERNHQVAHQ